MKIFRNPYVRLAVTLLCFALMLLYLSPQRIADATAQADFRIVALAIPFTLPLIAARITRWRILVVEEIEGVGWYAIIVSYLMGLMLSTFTPSGVGEIARVNFLPQAHQHRVQLAAKTVLDKLVDVTVLSALGGIGLLLSPSPPAQLLGVLLYLSILMGAGAALWIRHQGLRLQGNAAWQKALNSLATIPLSTLVKLTLLSGIGFFFLYLQLYIVLRGFVGDVDLEVVIFFPLITLSTILPITLNGLGIREWTAVFLLQRYELDAAAIFNSVILHFAIVTIPPVMVGLVMWLRRPTPTAN